MNKWKIIALIPYLFIGGWMLISFITIGTGGIGGIFVGAAFFVVGLMGVFIYSGLLGLALIIRFFILKLKNIRTQRAR